MNSWYDKHKLHLPSQDSAGYDYNNWYSSSKQSDNGTDRHSQSRKDGLAYGGLAYYDNALYTGPHSYKGSFAKDDDYPEGTYRHKKSRWLIPLIVIILLLVVGIAVFLGVYFGILEKPDTITTSAPIEQGKFQVTMKLNQNWDPKYADTNSAEYQNTKTMLENELTDMYQNSNLQNDFQSVSVTGISEGSIVVVFVIIADPTTLETRTSMQQKTLQAVNTVKSDPGTTFTLLKTANVATIVVDNILVTSTPTTTTMTTTTTPTTTTPTTTTPTTTTPTTTTPTTTTPTTTTPTTTTPTTTTPTTTTPTTTTPTTTTPTTTTPTTTTPTTTTPTTTTPTTTTPTTTTPTTTTPTTTTPTTTTPTTTTPTTTTPTTTTPTTTTPTTTTPTTTTPTTTTPTTTTPTTTTPTTTTPTTTTPTTTTPTTTTPTTTTPTTTTPTTTTPTTTTPTTTTLTTTTPTTTTPTTTTILTTTTTPTTPTVPTTTSTPTTTSPTTTTPQGPNPCVDFSLLGPIATSCIIDYAKDLVAQGTDTEGICGVLQGSIIPCIVNKTKAAHGRTCTEKEQYNIIVSNKDIIESAVKVDPMLCIPTPSCASIEAITYFMPILCESQIQSLRSSGSCSDFSDALKCYYYHIGIGSQNMCDMNVLLSTVSNNFTEWVKVIKKPEPNTCTVSFPRLDTTVNGSLCDDPDAMQVIVEMYCPHDLNDFVQASEADKCMYGHTLVVCIVQQLSSVFKTTCHTDNVYQQMKIHQEKIIGVAGQPNVQSCQSTPATTEGMTTTEIMTTEPTVIPVEGEFEAEMKINATWDPKYEDKNSTEYKDLTEKFRNQTLEMYRQNSSLPEVKDIEVTDALEGSVRFIYRMTFKGSVAVLRELTPAIVLQKTKEIVQKVQEEIKNNPELAEIFDLLEKTQTEEIVVVQVVVVMTDCDRKSYIRSLVRSNCENARQQLAWANMATDQCRIFHQVAGCVMFFARQCSAKKVVRTLTSHLGFIIGNMNGFDAETCYDPDDVVLPTMMPITAPVRPCVHPDVLNYVMNFDCFYDSAPYNFDSEATIPERCRFYWQSAACAYNTLDDNPDLAVFGKCSYGEVTGVLESYEEKMYRVGPQKVNASVCFAYEDDKDKCSTVLYHPQVNKQFRQCFYRYELLAMSHHSNDTSLKCLLYEESFECVYRLYNRLNFGNCDMRKLEQNVMWFANSMNGLMSKSEGEDWNEPDIVKNCIENSSNRTDFGQSLCMDGNGILSLAVECFTENMPTSGQGICSVLQARIMPCVKGKLAEYNNNCTMDELTSSVIKASRTVQKLTNGRVDLSQCTGVDLDDVCVAYRQEVVYNVPCGMTIYGFNKTIESEDVFCRGYNVYLNCLKDTTEKNTGKKCKLSSLDGWMPDVLPHIIPMSNMTANDVRRCNVTDDDFCDDAMSLEAMAFHSGCGEYVKYIPTYPDCSTIIRPYFTCLEGMFSKCNEMEMADTLLKSPKFSALLPAGTTGTDILDCLDFDTTEFAVTFKLNVTYKVEYSDKTSPAYQQFTSQFKAEFEMVVSGSPFKDNVLSFEIVDVRLGSTLIGTRMKLAAAAKASDVRTAVAGMITAVQADPNLQLPLLKAIDPSAIRVIGQDDGKGSDVCAAYSQSTINITANCSTSLASIVLNKDLRHLFCSGYDIYINCVQFLMEQSTGKTCLKSSLQTWIPNVVPYYANFTKEDAEACNVTSRAKDICDDVKAIERMAFHSACGAYLQYLNITTDCRLIIKPYVSCVAIMFPFCDVEEIVESLNKSQAFTSLLPPGTNILPCIKGEIEQDACSQYSEAVSGPMWQCGGAIYGYLMGSTPKDMFCSAYNVYLGCIHKLTERNTGRKCGISTLNVWMPSSISTFTNITTVQAAACKVMEEDDLDDMCHDRKLLEKMAVESSCGVTLPFMKWLPNCSTIIQPYFNCLTGLFPYCDNVDLIDFLMESENFTAKLPPKDDVLDCVGDICSNYTGLVENFPRCSAAVTGLDEQTHVDVLCLRYDIYLSCLQVRIKNSGKNCRKLSLRKWMPEYVDKKFNISESYVKTCNVTDRDADEWCTNVHAVEMMVLNSTCAKDFEMMQRYPNCINAQKMLTCVEGIFPECDGEKLARTILSSTTIRSKIPSNFDPMTCFNDVGTGEYQAELKLDKTFDPLLADKNSEVYRNFTNQISEELEEALEMTPELQGNIEEAQVEDLGPGSIKVIVRIVIKKNAPFYSTLRAAGLQQILVRILKQLKLDPRYSHTLLFTVMPESINVTHLVRPETTTAPGPPSTTIAPDCNSVAYIKQFAQGLCDSSRNQLTLVDNNKKCRVFLDMVGCIMFQTGICTPEEVVGTLNRDFVGIVKKNMTSFDPSTCYADANNVVLPSIIPPTATTTPCKNPDVLRYMLRYDCYYDAVLDHVTGDKVQESCRFYWYAASCVYNVVKSNPMLGQCSYHEIKQVLDQYQSQLFTVSPNNVNTSDCFNYDLESEKCSTVMYYPDMYLKVFNCFSSVYLIKLGSFWNATLLDCVLYRESSECVYRLYEKEGLGHCDKQRFEQDVIWATNTYNSVMQKATGFPLSEPAKVENCLANSTMDMYFGRDLCDDPEGLILTDATCIFSLQFSGDVCSTLRSTYTSCLENKLRDSDVNCTADKIQQTAIYGSHLIQQLTWGRVVLYRCESTIGKAGTCPTTAVANQTVCQQQCTTDFFCPGTQKCCPMGCSQLCMNPDTVQMSRQFRIAMRFQIPWKSEYMDMNSTEYMNLTAHLAYQFEGMLGNSPLASLLKSFSFDSLMPGSVIVTFTLRLTSPMNARSLQQMISDRIASIQQDPSSQLHLIKSIDQTYTRVDAIIEVSDVCTSNNPSILSIASPCAGVLTAMARRTDLFCSGYNVYLNCVAATVEDVTRQTCRKSSLGWITNFVKTSLNLTDGSFPACSITPDDQDMCSDPIALEAMAMYSPCGSYLQHLNTSQDCGSVISPFMTCLGKLYPGCDKADLARTLTTTPMLGSMIQGIDIVGCIEGSKVDVTVGQCPAVANGTVGICLQGCNNDGNCTGNYKCCFNGCGHTCMEPVSMTFKLTFKLNITWDDDYADKNSEKYKNLSAMIINQLYAMLNNSDARDSIGLIKILGFRPGSVEVSVMFRATTHLKASGVQMTTQTLVKTIQASPGSSLIHAIHPDSIQAGIYTDDDDAEDVCTDSTIISVELTKCMAYISYVNDTDANNCAIYKYFLNCVVNEVRTTRKRCDRNSLMTLMKTLLPLYNRPDLLSLLNCSDSMYPDSICVDRRAIEQVFNVRCRSFLPAFVGQTPCQALTTIRDTCMIPSMPGSNCDDSAMLSTLLNISAIANVLPSDFDRSSCNTDGHSGNDKAGSCPAVTNQTVGICPVLCRDDRNCSGNYKCCSNGCGFICVEPVSRMFLLKFKLNITWDPDYANENSTKYKALVAMILNQFHAMLNNSDVRDVIAWIKILRLSRGSVWPDLMFGSTSDLTASVVQTTTADLVGAVQADPDSPLAIIHAIDPDSIKTKIYDDDDDDDDDDAEDVCKDNTKISVELTKCMAYISYVNDTNADNCPIYKYFLNCVVNEVRTTKKSCERDSLKTLMKTLLPLYNLLPLLNCSDSMYPDNICVDRRAIEQVFNVRCRSLLPAFTSQTPCQALTTIRDSCMIPSMPGSYCDRSDMLSTLSNISAIANVLPNEFDSSSCSYTPYICYGSWENCPSTTNCHNVSWSYNNHTDLITFEIRATIGTDKWLGIGFNSLPAMPGADVIVGWVTPSGTVKVKDRFAEGHFMPAIDTEQNIQGIKGYHVNGITSIKFQRPRTTNSTQDFQFSDGNCAYFLYALGGTYNDATNSIEKHQSHQISTHKICFPDCTCFKFVGLWSNMDSNSTDNNATLSRAVASGINTCYMI